MGQEYAPTGGLASRCAFLHRACRGRTATRHYDVLAPRPEPIGVAHVSQRKDPSAAFRPRERVHALRRAGLLDLGPEPVFDRLTQLTCRVFDAPLALVALLDGDRLFVKSQHGLPESSATA